MLKSDVKLDIAHVAYRGSAPMLQDLMADQVQVALDSLPAAIGFIKAGQLRALAVTARDEASGVAGAPPLAATVPGFEAESWFAPKAPRGTPKAIIDRLSRASDEYLKAPEATRRLNGTGAVPVGGTPESPGEFIAKEVPKWKRAVEMSGARID